MRNGRGGQGVFTTDQEGMKPWVTVIVVMLAMAVGLFLRLRHLGHLGLVVDEGFQALAVQGILHHRGVPLLASGEVYLRSPLFLYIQAGFAAVLGETAFALRLPAVLFGVLCIPAAYFLGKEVFSRPVGLVLAGMIAMSAWEIELSRYARFYTAFELAYMVGITLFIRGFLKREMVSKVGFFMVAAIAVSLHQLGIMLACCFLALAVGPGMSVARRLFGLVGAGAVVGLWFAFNKAMDLAASLLERRPSDGHFAYVATPPIQSPHHWLDWLLGSLPPLRSPLMHWFWYAAHEYPVVLGVLGIVPVLASLFLIGSSGRGRRIATALLLAMVWAAYTGQAALTMTFAVFYLGICVRDRHGLVAPRVVAAVRAAGLCLGGYVLWFVVSPEIATRLGVVWMLRFPDVYIYFLQWFVPGWPVIWMLLLAAVILLARQSVVDDPQRTIYLLLASIFLPVVITSLLLWRFSESRYFFHLYPLMLAAVAWLAASGLRRFGDLLRAYGLRVRVVVPMVVVLVVVFASRDLNPLKAYRIGGREPTTRKDPIRSVLGWGPYAHFQQDLRDPARYVRERMKRGEVIVVVGPPHDAAVYRYYLGRVDYVVSSFVDGKPAAYTNARLLASGGYLDPVADARIIHSKAQLKRLVRQKRAAGIWLLSDKLVTDPKLWFLSKPTCGYLAKLTSRPAYVGPDGQTIAVKLN